MDLYDPHEERSGNLSRRCRLWTRRRQNVGSRWKPRGPRDCLCRRCCCCYRPPTSEGKNTRRERFHSPRQQPSDRSLQYSTAVSYTRLRCQMKQPFKSRNPSWHMISLHHCHSRPTLEAHARIKKKLHRRPPVAFNSYDLITTSFTPDGMAKVHSCFVAVVNASCLQDINSVAVLPALSNMRNSRITTGTGESNCVYSWPCLFLISSPRLRFLEALLATDTSTRRRTIQDRVHDCSEQHLSPPFDDRPFRRQLTMTQRTSGVVPLPCRFCSDPLPAGLAEPFEQFTVEQFFHSIHPQYSTVL